MHQLHANAPICLVDSEVFRESMTQPLSSIELHCWAAASQNAAIFNIKQALLQLPRRLNTVDDSCVDY
jgi:hypothetical protein